MSEDITDLNGMMVDSSETFNKIIKKMHEEGSGLITANVLTPSDATKMVIGAMMGALPDIMTCYLMECDKFLTALEENHPICSAGDCTNEMKTFTDVGCIVIVHGMTDQPNTFIVAGVCESCWKEKFEHDTEKAMEAFLAYLRQCLPGFKSYNQDEFMARMAGNAPSSGAVN